MKYLIALFVLTFCLHPNLYSQSHKLLEISQGKLTYSKVLRNLKDDLLGYVFVFEKKSEKSRNPDYEYVLLDSNLHVVTKQTHSNHFINYYTSYIQDIVPFGDSLLVYKKYCCAYYCFTSFYYISTQMHFKSKEFVRSKEKLEPLILNKNSYKDYYNEYTNQSYYVISKENNRYLIDPIFYEHKPDGSFILNKVTPANEILRDTIPFSTVNRKKDLKVEILLLTDSKMIILVEEFNKQGIIIGNARPSVINKFIQCIDIYSGKTLYSYPIELSVDKFMITVEAMENGNNMIYSGKYGDYKKNKKDSDEKSLGLFYIHLDSIGKEVKKSFISWAQFDPIIKMDKDGKNKDGYKLRILSSKLLSNGSIAILADHFKSARDGIFIPGISAISSLVSSRSERSKDFVTIHINKLLELESCKLLYTELTKGRDYDYFYSDYTKDKNGTVSFYKDENKDNNKGSYILGIIKSLNNNVELDKVEISNPESKKLIAIPAKKEFVIIAEVDKNDNLVEMRLEKINL